MTDLPSYRDQLRAAVEGVEKAIRAMQEGIALLSYTPEQIEALIGHSPSDVPVRTAALWFQVIEETSYGPWVIAKFDTEADAERFVDCVGRRLTIRIDPNYAALVERARELRRSPYVHPAHEEIEP